MTDRDRRIHEQIMGKCWHEHMFGTCPSICKKCKKSLADYYGYDVDTKKVNPSYLDWQNYGPLLQKLHEREDWFSFISSVYIKRGSRDTLWSIILDPERGCEAIDKFFCKEG